MRSYPESVLSQPDLPMGNPYNSQRSFKRVSGDNRSSKGGRPAKIDYKALAKSEDTCVFLMGFSKIKEIAEGLLLAGKDPQCPVAVISNATLPKQRTCIGTLETIVQKTREVFLEPPALIVVGNVVRLRSSLNFFEEKPLFGKRYLVTKIGEETTKLTSGLREMGGDVTEIQTGR